MGWVVQDRSQYIQVIITRYLDGKVFKFYFSQQEVGQTRLREMCNWERILGLRISNSRMMVFFPASAITAPILVLANDFPSPLNDDVTRITGFGLL